jgi:hypothetical protein
MILTVLDVDGAHNFEHGMNGLKIPWKQLTKLRDIEQAAVDSGWTNVTFTPVHDLYDKYCAGTDRQVLDLSGYCIMTLEK